MKKDERSDNEEDDEDVEVTTKAANGSAALPNGDGQSLTRRNAGKDQQAPQVLLNGEPVADADDSTADKKDR